MRPPRGRELGISVLWVAILVVAVALVWQVGRAITDDREPVVAEARAGELTVRDALVRTPQRPVAVRGYVFRRERFPPELCAGRLPGDPPRCMGPTILLLDLDLTRLDLRRGSDKGIEVLWTAEPVAILGHLSTATMRVQEILR